MKRYWKIIMVLMGILGFAAVIYAAGGGGDGHGGPVGFEITESKWDTINEELKLVQSDNIPVLIKKLEPLKGHHFDDKKEFEKTLHKEMGEDYKKYSPLILFHANIKTSFPRPLESYVWEEGLGISEILKLRIIREPFNLVATLIFLCAIVHTFLSSKFLAIAHKWEHEHHHLIEEGKADRDSVHLGSKIFHFLGEVEAIFGLWAVPLAYAIVAFHEWGMSLEYIGTTVNYTEPMFVVIIMTLAATRPVLKLSELMMWKVSNAFGGTLQSWWLTILTIGPVLGSFITEPAAMTISALLLANKFYDLNPSENFKYATIGLLFVNISVGGTLSHFAAPPVLMVASKWDWGLSFMFVNFGWKAVFGIILSNIIYFYMYRKELDELQLKYAIVKAQREMQNKYIKRKQLEIELEKIAEETKLGCSITFDDKSNYMNKSLMDNLKDQMEINDKDIDPKVALEAFNKKFDEIRKAVVKKLFPGILPKEERPPYDDPDWDNREDWVPKWVMVIHVIFMAWTVYNAHHPPLFVAGFLFYLGFSEITPHYQNKLDLKPALLVGFFLAGLVIHGGVQGWWIAPVLGSLTEIPLMVGATILTAFNDNAAITYLSTLVPNFSPALKYAVVAGAVTGGGLTVIANAPNPAGQSILKKYFENGVNPARLAKSAIIPTIILGLCFMLLRF